MLACHTMSMHTLAVDKMGGCSSKVKLVNDKAAAVVCRHICSNRP